MIAPHLRHFLRPLIIVVWIILIALLAQREFFVPRLDEQESLLIERARQESYYSIRYQGKRIGFLRNSEVSRADGSAVDVRMNGILRLNTGEKNHDIDMQLHTRLDDRHRLQNFEFFLDSSLFSLKAKGVVQKQTLNLFISSGSYTNSRTLLLQEAPFITTYERGYLLRRGIDSKDRLRIPAFDPISRSIRDTIFEYQGKKKILIRGRVHSLHQFSRISAGSSSLFWLNDRGKVIKENAAMGISVLARPEFKARELSTTGLAIGDIITLPGLLEGRAEALFEQLMKGDAASGKSSTAP